MQRFNSPSLVFALAAVSLRSASGVGTCTWGLYSSAVERQSCKLKVLDLIPSGGFVNAPALMLCWICGPVVKALVYVLLRHATRAKGAVPLGVGGTGGRG